MLPRALAGLALLGGLMFAAPAASADPQPFGHPCAPQAGVLFCPGASDADRVAGFDGVPLDVDVTLPSSGAPPYPTIVMLHSLGGDKRMLESDTPEGVRSVSGLAIAGSASLDHYNNLYFASRGFAVVNPSSRGWGRSCGKPDSRTTPDCARGWLHFLDQRYEARDVQHLLGILVDEGIARADALGVTGISMGGGTAVRLAFLNDRVRLPDGSFAAWTSPAGIPLHIAAAYARWGAGSGIASLLPNGRPFGPDAADPGTTPLGVLKQSSIDFLFNLAAQTGYVAPVGADPTADFAGWRAALGRGEPYGAAAQAAVRELADFHSAFSALGPATPPLLLEAGYSDDVTGALEVVRVYRRLMAARSGPVQLQLGDVGHFRATNPPATVRAMNAAGDAFLESVLLASGAPPARGAVAAFPETCPPAASIAPLTAPDLDSLATRMLRLRGGAPQTISSKGGSPAVAAAVTPRLGGSSSCSTVKRDRSREVASYSWPADGRLLSGTPVVTATIRATGAEGQLAFRLWDIDRGGMERLVTRAAYRVTKSERGRIHVPVGLSVYRFARGHAIRLEVLGRDPAYLRPSNGRFSVRLSRLSLTLPVRS